MRAAKAGLKTALEIVHYGSPDGEPRQTIEYRTIEEDRIAEEHRTAGERRIAGEPRTVEGIRSVLKGCAGVLEESILIVAPKQACRLFGRRPERPLPLPSSEKREARILTPGPAGSSERRSAPATVKAPGTAPAPVRRALRSFATRKRG